MKITAFKLSFCLLMIHLKNTYARNLENEYKYDLERDKLIEEEEKFSHINQIDLDEDEKIVNGYLHFLKIQEFLRTRDPSIGFPPARPIEEKLDEIRQSEVFLELSKLPKGGNMHTHENYILSHKTCLEILYDSPQFEDLYVAEESDSLSRLYALDFFVNPPPISSGQKWVKVKDNSTYSIEFFLQKHLLMNILTDEAKRYPTDSRMRWKLMDTLWGKVSSTFRHVNIRVKFLTELLNGALKENVQYIETRASRIQRLYVLDKSGQSSQTFGKRYIDANEEFPGKMNIDFTRDIVNHFKSSHPEFIGYKIIAASTRKGNNDQIKNDLRISKEMYEKAGDMIKGIDLVAEEDAGKSHMFFLENLLNISGNPSPLYHTAETNWPDDLVPSDFENDPVSALQNTYEAVLLGAKRIGHGIGLFKHPYLLEELKKRDVAIEICPISNQILGYTADLRNHPGVGYIRSGLPVVLGSDDPSGFGYDNFTIDWYAVFMAWGLDLRDLKRLSQNSIKYSGLNDTEKAEAMQKWESSWNDYISTSSQKACKLQFKLDPIFNRILPREGALNGGGNVHVYGRHFEKGICQTIKCKFGNYDETDGELINTYQIKCPVPQKSSNTIEEAPLSVALNGTNFINTNLKFTFKYNNEEFL